MWATGNSLIAAKDILKAKGYKNIWQRTKRLTLKTTNKATFVAAFLYTVNKPFIEKSTAMKSEQYQGKVKQYDADKGYGFIASPEGEVFFHISDFPAAEGEPKRNERVKFMVVDNGGKFKAVRIERVEDQSAKAKKSKVATHNQSITSSLLSNFRK